MKKITHEIRDPIHVFIKMSSDERKILDTPFFQRLRHIHQLATSYLVYPGATHKRFEHSLGVMELAGRVFDVITHPESLLPRVRELLPEINETQNLYYWRSVLRMAALCHDLGHVPFSHASEKELLPKGWNHEKITIELIKHLSSEFEDIVQPLKVLDVQKLAVGPSKLNVEFTDWETILSEIIVGDCFGVDRMDYLLRDSYHTGVAYGKFDHYRLIDTLRILPEKHLDSEEPSLGVEEGGLHSAEALLLARYFMFSQVYFHPVRRIYDIHLRDFLKEWLDGGLFSTAKEKHQNLTDNEVLAGIRASARDSNLPGHEHAKRILNRGHFKLLYQRQPGDMEVNPDPGGVIYKALAEKFGKGYFRRDVYPQKGSSTDFPVSRRDGSIVSSLALSGVLNNIPIALVDFVFVDREKEGKAREWLDSNKEEILKEE